MHNPTIAFIGDISIDFVANLVPIISGVNYHQPSRDENARREAWGIVMRKTLKVFALSAVMLLLGLLWQPGIAAQAAPNHGIAPASAREALLANWVPWDGNHITTYQKCLNRRSYIATTYGIPYSALRCDQRNDGLPPCQTYWILMVNTDATLRATGFSPARTVTQQAPVETTTEAACV